MSKQSKQIAEYLVIRAPEGAGEEFIGHATNLSEARELAEAHESGQIAGTPEHLWETARAAGRQVAGCSAPPAWYNQDREPYEWAGRDGSYAIVRR